MSRIVKQLLYGILYLAVFVAIGWGIYSVTLKPAPSCFDNTQNGGETGVDCGGPCVSCEVKNLHPLDVTNPLLLGSDRVFAGTAQVLNTNSAYGASAFSYTMSFYDASGNALQTVKGSSFVYPGQTKDIIEAGVRIENGIPARVGMALDPSTVAWANATDFTEPAFQVKDASTTIESGQVVVTGTIVNPNNFPLSKTIIGAFAVSRLGAEVGASRTELDGIGAFQEQTFNLFIPVAAADLRNVDLSATMNSVEADAVK
ncbi:MAG: hypothetical protein KGI60_03340 [Patescibacteria group bacterium]|nr:hypothetical protein [Patescibacteria group bacterium]